MYVVVAHFEEAVHAHGPFLTKEDAQAAIESLGPPTTEQDYYYYLTPVKVEHGPINRWWSELTE